VQGTHPAQLRRRGRRNVESGRKRGCTMQRWLGLMCLIVLAVATLVSVGQAGWTNAASNGEADLGSTEVTRPLHLNGVTPTATPTAASTPVPTPVTTPTR
jgi:hypothetical protein